VSPASGVYTRSPTLTTPVCQEKRLHLLQGTHSLHAPPPGTPVDSSCLFSLRRPSTRPSSFPRRSIPPSLPRRRRERVPGRILNPASWTSSDSNGTTKSSASFSRARAWRVARVRTVTSWHADPLPRPCVYRWKTCSSCSASIALRHPALIKPPRGTTLKSTPFRSTALSSVIYVEDNFPGLRTSKCSTRRTCCPYTILAEFQGVIASPVFEETRKKRWWPVGDRLIRCARSVSGSGSRSSTTHSFPADTSLRTR